ncbi:WD40 repeat domain-containing protein [Gemmata sp. JC673]|uniref:WD40 repeat domain-containing protein n=1 Tax=Gemmata algarum TaxID=2975278 RepID=A0ABU5F9X6_9BACT|nr:WD40 repeat domain-containing protein [Gemmata algarum]MDY3562646.1 WD40 repeat domain-containing protein [Gemmata algarum]
MRVLDAGANGAGSVCFSPDGRTLAVGGRAVVVFSLFDDRRLPVRLRTGAVRQLAFHPHLPRLFALAGNDFRVDDIDDSGFRPRFQRLTYADRFALGPDGGAVLSGRFDLERNGSRLRRYADVSNAIDTDWPTDPAGDGNLHWGLAWVPGTDRFAVAEWEGEFPEYRTAVTVRAAATGGVVAKTVWGSSACTLAAAPDGTLIAAAKAVLAVWPGGDLARPPRTIANDSRKHFTGIAFHPSGRYFAATSNDATVKLYDTASWEAVRTFAWDIGRTLSVAFSPDGALAAVGSDTGKVVVWDVDL